MLSIRFDEKREWWVSTRVFDRLFEAAIAGGLLEPELQHWLHVAHANGGFSFDADEREAGERVERALTAAARRELAALGDVDLQGEDGTYKVSLEKLLVEVRSRMRRLRLSVVNLLFDLPEHGLKRGAIGTVVEVLESPSRAYEVEFCDDSGRTIAQVALTEQQIETA